MARPRVNPDEAARAAFKQEVRVKRAYYDIQQKQMAAALDIGAPRMSALMAKPDDLTVARLREIVKLLHLSPDVVLAFLGYTQKEIRGLSDRKQDPLNV